MGIACFIALKFISGCLLHICLKIINSLYMFALGITDAHSPVSLNFFLKILKKLLGLYQLIEHVSLNSSFLCLSLSFQQEKTKTFSHLSFSSYIFVFYFMIFPSHFSYFTLYRFHQTTNSFLAMNIGFCFLHRMLQDIEYCVCMGSMLRNVPFFVVGNTRK